MLNNKNILITGGTGSFGQAFTAKILKKFPRINKIIILVEMNLNKTICQKNIIQKKKKKYYVFF